MQPYEFFKAKKEKETQVEILVERQILSRQRKFTFSLYNKFEVATRRIAVEVKCCSPKVTWM